MRKVQRLPDVLINQIAAGEVVERPASVVKELLENALDAGAGSIDVSVEQGGRRSLRVEDDGHGMAPEDAQLALQRHATSKIRSLADLEDLQSLGFRGEALPAIASVSRLTLRTAAAAGAGFRIELDAGRVRGERPDPHPVGTTVEVRDLFHNTPARAKFLRTVSTELSRITEVVQACALAHPAVRFRLRHDGRELLAAPAAADLPERLRQVFGRELRESLLHLEAGSPPLTVDGYVSRPAFSRGTRGQWFQFVNGRLISDRAVTHAISQACRSHFPRDRYPAVFLFLQVPPAQVDVNVHPAKREVRFRTPGAIHALVQQAIENALESARPVQEIEARGSLSAGRPAVAEALSDYMTQAHAGPAPGRFTQSRVVSRESGGQPAAAALPTEVRALRLLGQLRDTYLLVEEPEGLLLVDQHAAHERVLYDRYRAALERREMRTQALLFPVTVELTPAQAARADAIRERLAELGFAVEPFGGSAFAVREVPALLASADPGAILRDLAEEEEDEGATLEGLEHRVAALAACHASVRAGMRLEPARMERIVQDLLGGDHALTCPHGRPATLRYPIREIGRAFLRPRNGRG